MKTTPTYVQAAGSGLGSKGHKAKRTSAFEIARDGPKAIKPPWSLPLASRRFFAVRTDPVPHALGQRNAATFPNIAATTLTDYNCLLPQGFISKVNK